MKKKPIKKRLAVTPKARRTGIVKEPSITVDGVEYSRKNLQHLLTTLSRTTVSRGRFPTEADLLLNAYRDPTARVSTKAVISQATKWKNNYLRAIKIMEDSTSNVDASKDWRSIYNIVEDMSLDDFIDRMYSYEELSVAFTYEFNSPELASSLLDKWER